MKKYELKVCGNCRYSSETATWCNKDDMAVDLCSSCKKWRRGNAPKCMSVNNTIRDKKHRKTAEIILGQQGDCSSPVFIDCFDCFYLRKCFDGAENESIAEAAAEYLGASAGGNVQ